MKTLDEFNEDARKRFWEEEKASERRPRLNGIACPKCGAEMVDSSPGMILTSIPPQLNVHCPACQYQGFRVR